MKLYVTALLWSLTLAAFDRQRTWFRLGCDWGVGSPLCLESCRDLRASQQFWPTLAGAQRRLQEIHVGGCPQYVFQLVRNEVQKVCLSSGAEEVFLLLPEVLYDFQGGNFTLRLADKLMSKTRPPDQTSVAEDRFVSTQVFYKRLTQHDKLLLYDLCDGLANERLLDTLVMLQGDSNGSTFPPDASLPLEEFLRSSGFEPDSCRVVEGQITAWKGVWTIPSSIPKGLPEEGDRAALVTDDYNLSVSRLLSVAGYVGLVFVVVGVIALFACRSWRGQSDEGLRLEHGKQLERRKNQSKSPRIYRQSPASSRLIAEIQRGDILTRNILAEDSHSDASKNCQDGATVCSLEFASHKADSPHASCEDYVIDAAGRRGSLAAQSTARHSRGIRLVSSSRMKPKRKQGRSVRR